MYKKYKDLPTQQENKTHYDNKNNDMTIISPEHKSQIINGNSVVCIDMFANWCAPCKQIAPKFAQLARKHNKPGVCALFKEDIDKKFSQDLNITAVPTFLFYKDGKLVKKLQGGNLAAINHTIINLLQS